MTGEKYEIKVKRFIELAVETADVLSEISNEVANDSLFRNDLDSPSLIRRLDDCARYARIHLREISDETV